jgi:NIMA (never in mitosis gene a)-related kinase
VEEKEIWTMMRQLLSGLAILHERNIIHRDLKCANIFIANGEYKIADLNVSKLLKKELAYTQTGTPYYASPEVWQDKPYELKSDIWTFGCIVYELCALKPPFTGNNMEGLFRKVMRGLYPKIPSTYSDKMGRAIDLCLQLDPAKRPTAKDLLKFIDEGRPEPSKSRVSSINLLNTIKLPKNYDSWKDELPKADYDTSSDRDSDSEHPKYGQISQNRLREIVRSKNEESLAKKETNKRINPEVPPTVRQELRPTPADKPALDKPALDRPALEKQQIRRSGLEGLPRLKMHSEPNDRVNELLAKLKEEERRRVDYSKPAWWG